MLYTEWALKEPNVPAWTNSQMAGALSPARIEPEFRLHSQSHGFSDVLTVDQLLTPIQVIAFLCLSVRTLCSLCSLCCYYGFKFNSI